jgi:hypothetical protein
MQWHNLLPENLSNFWCSYLLMYIVVLNVYILLFCSHELMCIITKLCTAGRVSCWVNSSSLPTAVKHYRLLSTLLQRNVNPSYLNKKDWIEHCTINRRLLTVYRTSPYYLNTLSVEVDNFWKWNSILNTRWHYFLCYIILSKNIQFLWKHCLRE